MIVEIIWNTSKKFEFAQQMGSRSTKSNKWRIEYSLYGPQIPAGVGHKKFECLGPLDGVERKGKYDL